MDYLGPSQPGACWRRRTRKSGFWRCRKGRPMNEVFRRIVGPGEADIPNIDDKAYADHRGGTGTGEPTNARGWPKWMENPREVISGRGHRLRHHPGAP